MAFEGVARRRPLPLWPFLLLAAGVIGALVLFFTLRDDPRRLEVGAPREAATQAGYAGAITEIGPLVAATDRRALEGREVALEGVQVLQVLGERTFLIGPGMSQKALVVWQPEAGAAAGAPPPKIDAGDTVAVHGVVQPLPTSRQALADWRIDQMSPSELTAMQVAVVAKAVIETTERSGAR